RTGREPRTGQALLCTGPARRTEWGRAAGRLRRCRRDRAGPGGPGACGAGTWCSSGSCAEDDSSARWIQHRPHGIGPTSSDRPDPAGRSDDSCGPGADRSDDPRVRGPGYGEPVSTESPWSGQPGRTTPGDWTAPAQQPAHVRQGWPAHRPAAGTHGPGNAEPGNAVVDARQRLARHDRRRRWRIAGDIAVGVLLYVVGLVIVMIASTGMHGAFGADGQLRGVGVLLVLLGWVLWLTVFVRSRWPWVPLAAGLVLALLGGDVLLLLIGVFHAVVRLPRRQAVGAAVTGAVVVAAALVRTAVRAPQYNPFAIFVLPPDAVLHDGMQYDISSDTAIVLRVLVLTLGIAAIGIAAGVGYLVRRTRRMRTVETFAAHQTERSEALTEQLARQSEREMLARELHDTLAHRLSVISLHSGALMVSAGDPERTVQTATALQREAKASLEEVRSIVRDVRGEDRSSASAPGTASAPALATLRTVPDLVASFRAT